MSGTPKLPNTFPDCWEASRAVGAMSRAAKKIGALGSQFPRIRQIHELAVKAHAELFEHWRTYGGGSLARDERDTGSVLDIESHDTIMQSQIVYAARLDVRDIEEVRRFRFDHPVRRRVHAVRIALERLAKGLPYAIGDEIHCFTVSDPTDTTDGPVLSVQQTGDADMYLYEVLDIKRGVVRVRLGVKK
jgi:hypothetical protein